MPRALATSLLVLVGASTGLPTHGESDPAGDLVHHLPAALPDISGWERSAGYAELQDPARSFEYELYVDPAYGAKYSVTRYRIHVDDPEEARKADITDTEKLQWDVDGRTLRRFECRPVAHGPCVWVEFEFDSPEYRRELKPIFAVYALHRRLLHEREQAGRD